MSVRALRAGVLVEAAAHVCAHISTLAHTRAHEHTRTHAHTHTRTHTSTRTRRRTRACPFVTWRCAVWGVDLRAGPYSSLSGLSDRACSEVHAEVAAAMSGGDAAEEEDDIMKEMMEEIKAKVCIFSCAQKLKSTPPARHAARGGGGGGGGGKGVGAARCNTFESRYPIRRRQRLPNGCAPWPCTCVLCT